MKTKHAFWLLIGTILITQGNPFIINGQDLLGWLIIGYTAYKVIKAEYFNSYTERHAR